MWGEFCNRRQHITRACVVAPTELDDGDSQLCEGAQDGPPILSPYQRADLGYRDEREVVAAAALIRLNGRHDPLSVVVVGMGTNSCPSIVLRGLRR